MADDGQVVIGILVDLFQPLRPFHIGDLGLDADGAQLGRDDLAAAPGIGRGRQGKAQGQVLDARLGQQFFRQFGIIGGFRRQIGIIG
jgi:hypothetical protein